MYLPKLFEEPRVEELQDLIRKYPFGTLVTPGENGLQANHLPFLIESLPEPFGTLYAHVARANPVWQNLGNNHDVLAIFQGPHSYISPSWYVTRQETGMVAPTWNYAVVHAYGRLEAIEDAAWLRVFVDRLTSSHEASNPEPWSVSDAPAAYIENMLHAIVGLKLTVTSLVGKCKMSQNRPAQDRDNVIRVLAEQKTESSLAMADWIRKANNRE